MRALFGGIALLLLAGCSPTANSLESEIITDASRLRQRIIFDSPDFIFNVGDRVWFDFDQYFLTARSFEQLTKWVGYLKEYPGSRLVLEGHADERGTREYNIALGTRRADAVKAYLISQGIDASRLTTISYGSERPAVFGDNEEAWSQNRRVVGVDQ